VADDKGKAITSARPASIPILCLYPVSHHMSYRFSAKIYWEYLQTQGIAPKIAPPHTLILAMQAPPINWWQRRFWHQQVHGFTADIILLRQTAGEVGIASRIGIGGPATAALLEMVALWGVKNLVLLGFAGSLQANIPSGAIILPTMAIGNDGASAHYYPPHQSNMIENRSDWTNQLYQYLAIHFSTHQGAVWSTAAPYRETDHQIDQYSQQGICAVDMETAALFAVGQALNLQTAAVLIAHDSLSQKKWEPAPDLVLLQQTAAQLYQKLIPYLADHSGATS